MGNSTSSDSELLEQYSVLVDGIDEARRTLPKLKHMRDAMLRVPPMLNGRISLYFELPGILGLHKYEILKKSEDWQALGRNPFQLEVPLTLSRRIDGRDVTVEGMGRQWYRRPITDGQLHDLISVLKRGMIDIIQSGNDLADSIDRREEFHSISTLHISVDLPQQSYFYAQIRCRDDAIRNVFRYVREVFLSIRPQEGDIDDMLGGLSWVSCKSEGFFDIDGTTGMYTSEATARRHEDVSTDETDMASVLTCETRCCSEDWQDGVQWEDEEKQCEEWEMMLSPDDWDRLVDAVRKVDADYREKEYVGHRTSNRNRISLSLTVQLASGWAMLFENVGEFDARLLPIAEFLWNHGVSRQEVVVADR